MNIDRYVELWDNRPVRLLDIRYWGLQAGAEYREPSLSSNTFLLVRGRGEIWLDETLHTLEDWYVLHGSKGTHMRMKAETEIEVYWIVYMLIETNADMQEQVAGQISTFTLECEYGMKPDYPLPLLEQVAGMHVQWGNIAFLERIQMTSKFYQFLYELLTQMQQKKVSIIYPDRTRQAVRYMMDHYGKPLTVEHVAAVTNCSPRLLNKLFHNRMQASPGRVLARIRMDRAQELLLNTEATLQEIAERVGYANGYTFSRYFKKHAGVSPEHYRKQVEAGEGDGVAESACTNANDGSWTSLHARLIQSTNDRAQGWTKSMAGSAEGAGRGRTIQTSMGEVTVPAKPERVVVDWSLGEVLALGLTPMGTPHTLVDSNRLLGQYMCSETQDIGNHNQVSIEKVLELEPDLIITWDRRAFASFARIAPTVLYQSDDYRTVGEGITAMGHILNRSEEAVKWHAEYERRACHVRDSLLRQRKERQTFTMIDPNWGRDIQVVGNAATRGGRAAYGLLGLQPTQKVWQELFKQGRESIWIDQQEISEYTGDYLLVLRSDQSNPEGQALNWTDLNQAAGRGLIELEWENYFLSDPLSVLLQAEEMITLITNADRG
jgi:iron complex transport system substrate-binding protein